MVPVVKPRGDTEYVLKALFRINAVVPGPTSPNHHPPRRRKNASLRHEVELETEFKPKILILRRRSRAVSKDGGPNSSGEKNHRTLAVADLGILIDGED